MKNIRQFLLLIFLVSCSKESGTKSYFNSDFEDTKSSKINLNEFNSYGELMNSIEKIACSDRITNLSFNGVHNKKEIHIFSFCPDKMPVYDPKNRNTIYFEKGNLIKNEKIVSFDSLDYILNKDFKNYGENLNFADKPEKLVIIILDDKNGDLETLKNFLDKITKAYDTIGTSKSLKVMMDNYVEIPPMPKL
ncbi:hypothetical protein [Flavobacterium sp. CS20]|uniref:hypothetical protein n=1 Tax=Flavobacterium sp. CS20 TaxID=2775246 RepID=UPI001B3A3039|nr:hypothetical protein [Flavobacterium sp. CS20]QTY27891.1 hypothetical protein IGB25_05125 [Flavobacterium sp. CS20]